MRSLLLAVLFCIIQQVCNQANSLSYENQEVLRCTSITSSPTKLFNHPEFDIWAIGPNGTVDIRIVDTDKGRAKQVAMKFYDHCDVIIKDVNKFLKEMEWTKANTSDNWFDAYHDYSEIMLWYEELSERYSNLVTYEVIGESVEGRPMPALHITDRASSEDKKKIYFQCQTHASM
jgi:hypothetical protein